jgi:MFS family permease
MKKPRIFYGWITLAAAVLVTVISGGVFVGTFGVFLPVVCEAFHWSRASLSLALSLGILAFGIPGPLFGYLVNKLGSRTGIIIGNSIAAMAVAILFLANRTWHYYLLYTIIGLSSGLGGYIACSTLVNNWFVKKRTLVMGIFTSSGGISGFIFPPIATVLIASLDFRASWLVLAGLEVLGSVVLGGVLLIRNRPEDMGQIPDGEPPGLLTMAESSHAASKKSPGWSTFGILKSSTTWLIIAFASADALANGAVLAHQIAYVEDLGFTSMTAAGTASLQAAFSILGSLTFGALSLKLNMRRLTGAAFLLQVISLVILLTSKNLAMIYVYSGLMGISIGVIFTSMTTFVGAYYPRERFAQVIGVILPFFLLAQSISSLGVGAIHDATGQYTLAFSLLIISSAAGLICALLARPPANQDGMTRTLPTPSETGE